MCECFQSTAAEHSQNLLYPFLWPEGNSSAYQQHCTSLPADNKEAISLLIHTLCLHALFHFPFRCRCFHSPHYYTVTWICTRCSLPPRHHPFSIIKIMHPIYLKISSSARQIRNLLSSNGDGTMGTHMLCMH